MIWLTQNTFCRRLLSVPLIFLLTALMVCAAPLWLPISWLAGRLFSKARSALRCLSFITTYLLCESVGIVVSFLLWAANNIARGDRNTFLENNRKLQFWWAETLKKAAERLFRLRFTVDGLDALAGPGAIVLPRHTSIGDTIFPVSFYAKSKGLGVRYVLKRELLLDPCLDIVGNRLPNVFLDRVADNMSSELSAIRRLAQDADDTDSLVIYMEGTRFSQKKRARIVDLLRQRADAALLDYAERWHNILPPRLAGAMALMEGAPDKDLLFCAHKGFEGAGSFATLFNGGWMDTDVRIRFWRVPATEIPVDLESRKDFLLTQWDRMHREVAELNRQSQRDRVSSVEGSAELAKR